MESTQLKLSSESLAENDQLHQLMLESIRGLAVFRIDEEGRIGTWPTGAQQIFGFTAAEAMGQPAGLLDSSLAQNDQTGLEIVRARTTGNTPLERWHVRKDGSQFWGEGTLTALTDATGQLRGFVKVLRDATAQKLATIALQQAKTSAESANARLVSAVSHDLRTPLLPMMIWTQILGGESLPDREVLREGLDIIRKCVDEQHELIEKFVADARGPAENAPSTSARERE